MAENLHQRPKGILKKTDSVDRGDHGRTSSTCSPTSKMVKYDEMNVVATLHPEGKDYGHMKIQEPKTPFSYSHERSSESEMDGLSYGDAEDGEGYCSRQCLEGINAGSLAERLGHVNDAPRDKVLQPTSVNGYDEDGKDESEMSPEQLEKLQAFEKQRKEHYDEGHRMKKAWENGKKEGLLGNEAMDTGEPHERE